MNKFKEFCENTRTKAIVAAGTIASVTAACAMPVLASEPAAAAPNAQVVDAMSDVSADMLATGTAVVPLALAVIGLSLVVTFGIKIFKKVSTKS